MVCKITFTSQGARPDHAFTLVEMMVATALAGLVVTVIAMLSFFTTRSFVAATNYTNMSMLSRMALDNMSRSIRQAGEVTAYATNSITLLDGSGHSFGYAFDPGAQTLTSYGGGVTNTYLTQCNSLQFWIYQRTPISNTFDCYDTAYVTNAKLVQITWSCSRQIMGSKVNTETMESAKICMRNH
jgi:prepilin-type N-terminal cleavage/methylation domain-containing protein